MSSPTPDQSNAGSAEDVELLILKDRPYLTALSVALSLGFVFVFYYGTPFVSCAWVVVLMVFAYSLWGQLNKFHQVAFQGTLVLACWYVYRLLPWTTTHPILDWLVQTLVVLLSGAFLILKKDYLVRLQIALFMYPIIEDTISVVVIGFIVAWFTVVIVDITLKKRVDFIYTAMMTIPLLRTHVPIYLVYFGALVIYKTVELYGHGIHFEPSPPKLIPEIPEEVQLPPTPPPSPPPSPPPPSPPPIRPKKKGPGPLPIYIQRPEPKRPVAPVVKVQVDQDLQGTNFADIYQNAQKGP